MSKPVVLAASLLALMAPAGAFAQTSKPMSAPPPAMSQAEQFKFLVFFDWNKATLTPDARRVVAQAADEFKKTGQARINVTGFTDTSGSYAYNMRLSVRRADAVKAELIKLGVPAATIVAIGRGQNDLLVPTADGVREAQNRRVEIVFPKPPKVAAPPPPPAPVQPAAVPPPPPPPLKWAVTLGPWYGYSLRESDNTPHKGSNLVGPELTATYYFVPNWGAGVDFAGWNTIGTSQSDGYGGLGKFKIVHRWNIDKVHLTLGPTVGYAAGKGVQDSVIAGPEAGIEYDVSRQAFLYAKAAYENVFRNDFGQGIPNGGLGFGLRF